MEKNIMNVSNMHETEKNNKLNQSINLVSRCNLLYISIFVTISYTLELQAILETERTSIVSSALRLSLTKG